MEPSSLLGKKIILGITASISAYKTPSLLRDLIKLGAQVQVLLTSDASQFVSPSVLSNLSGKPVIIEQFDGQLSDQGAWHVKVANDYDLMLIAPLSANTLSKIACGLIDNALLLTLFALPLGNAFQRQKKIPVLLAPAMDSDMWFHPIIQDNVKKLQKIGYKILDPEEGELSSGLMGKGRLPENDVIIQNVIDLLCADSEEVTLNHNDKKDIYIEEVEVFNVKKEIDFSEVSFPSENDRYSDKYYDIQSKIKDLEERLGVNNNITSINEIDGSDENNEVLQDELKKEQVETQEEDQFELLKKRTREFLQKPIESIDTTLDNREFNVELELENLKKKVGL